MFDMESRIAAYNAVKIPEGYTGLPEPIYGLEEKRVTFYRALISALDLGSMAIDQYFDIRTRMLVPLLSDARPERNSDDTLDELVFDETHTLASLLCTRNPGNFETIHFAKYPLGVRSIARMREILEQNGDEQGE